MKSNLELFDLSVPLAETRDAGFTEYLVVLRIKQLEHHVYRRYKDFQSFDTHVKTTFPRVDLPPFPSKFVLYNKVKQRKKGFHTYLKRIHSLCKEFHEIPREMMMNLLAEFLGLAQPVAPVEEVKAKPSKSTLVDSAQVSADTGIIKAYIELRMHDNWIKYYAALQPVGLYLFPSHRDSLFTTMISIVRAEIYDGELPDVLEIHHKHQLAPIMIRTPQKNDWKRELLLMASANLDSPIASSIKQPVGRLRVDLYSAQNLKLIKPAVSSVKPHVFIRLTIDQFQFQSSIIECNNLVIWNQHFIVPILNRFFILKIEVVSFRSEGWIKQSAKEEVLAEFDVPLTDIGQYPYTKGPLTLYMNFTKKKQQKAYDKDSMPWINIDIKEECAFTALFQPPPSGYIENEEAPKTASMAEFKLISRRLKRLQILYSRFFETVHQAFLWTYPKFSWFCLVCYCLIAGFLPLHFIPFVLLFLILVLFFFTHPRNQKLYKYLQRKWFSHKQRIKPYPRVRTIKETLNDSKSSIEPVSIKVSEGMIDKWKKFKLDAIELQLILMNIASYGEKIRQLVLWEDPVRSYWTCVFLIIIMYVLIAIPMRLIILAIGIHRFYKGRKKTHRKILNNERATEEALKILLSAYVKDYELRPDSVRQWPEEITNNVSLQKKFVEGIRNSLDLDVTTDIFTDNKTPAELWEYLRSCEHILKLRNSKGEVVQDLHLKKSRDIEKDFIKNVPSEYYRYQHPRITNFETYSYSESINNQWKSPTQLTKKSCRNSKA